MSPIARRCRGLSGCAIDVRRSRFSGRRKIGLLDRALAGRCGTILGGCFARNLQRFRGFAPAFLRVNRLAILALKQIWCRLCEQPSVNPLNALSYSTRAPARPCLCVRWNLRIRLARSRSSSSAIRLRPHRSGRAAFPHPALPESHPHRCAFTPMSGGYEGAVRGSALPELRTSPSLCFGSSGCAA